jgi:sulfur-oxidizing protein SoxZ
VATVSTSANLTTTSAVVSMPAQVKRNEAFEIKTTIAHTMETGYRSGDDGRVLPRDILRRFECSVDGKLVFAVDCYAAIAANPYFAFFVALAAPSTVQFEWRGDNGFKHVETRRVEVT